MLQSVCFCCNVVDVMEEVQMTAAAINKPPPLALEPGHANEEGERRGMAPPKWGYIEVVNKDKEGEIIAILIAQNAAEVTLPAPLAVAACMLLTHTLVPRCRTHAAEPQTRSCRRATDARAVPLTRTDVRPAPRHGIRLAFRSSSMAAIRMVTSTRTCA